MKNNFKFLAALVFFLGISYSNVQAQTNKSSLQFGVKGGVNFSNLYTEEVKDNNVLTSFNVGVFATLPITNFLAIQSELLYSRKGAKLEYDNAFTVGIAKFQLNYIEVPVLLKVNITNNLNIHAGPYFAYLIDAQVKNESDSGNFDFEESYNNDDFNKFDYGLAGGIGFDFESFGIGARYNYGLNTVGKARTILGQSYTIPDGKNSNISLYISLQLN
jgi:hypothetical protein